jgi:hypothetical protein
MIYQVTESGYTNFDKDLFWTMDVSHIQSRNVWKEMTAFFFVRVTAPKLSFASIQRQWWKCKNIFARLYSIWLFTTSVSKMVSSVYSLLTINSMVSNFWCSRTVSKVYSKLIDYYNNFYVDRS